MLCYPLDSANVSCVTKVLQTNMQICQCTYLLLKNFVGKIKRLFCQLFSSQCSVFPFLLYLYQPTKPQNSAKQVTTEWSCRGTKTQWKLDYSTCILKLVKRSVTHYKNSNTESAILSQCNRAAVHIVLYLPPLPE